MELLSAEFFSDYKGQSFGILFNEVSEKCTLTSISYFTKHPHLQRQPFALLFECNSQKNIYPQATYTIEHPALGALPVFLVPVGPGKSGMQYEAVFS